jgi:acetyl esterase
LCDEGRAYAERLEKDGVRVSAVHLSDHIHGMLMHGKWIDAAPRMADFAGAWLAGMLKASAS